jgi:hypothetical protein
VKNVTSTAKTAKQVTSKTASAKPTSAKPTATAKQSKPTATAKKTTRKSNLSAKETHKIYHAAAKFAWLKIYADKLAKTKNAEKRSALREKIATLNAEIKKAKLIRAA